VIVLANVALKLVWRSYRVGRERHPPDNVRARIMNHFTCQGAVWTLEGGRWQITCSCEIGADAITRGLTEGTVVRSFDEIPNPKARPVWPWEWTSEEWFVTIRPF
jgi:hypothetical protein